MRLTDLFSSVAVKVLRTVDLPGRGSNQHEVNGAAALRDFFQTSERLQGEIKWYYFSEDEEVVTADSTFTFYDARVKSAARTGRSEWRLYYYGDFLSRATEGDLLVLARDKNSSVHALVFENDSSWVHAARYLFGFDSEAEQLVLLPEESLSATSIEFARSQILEALEIAVDMFDGDRYLDLVTRRFGNHFPSTKDMSDFARSVEEVDAKVDPDTALTTWIQCEENLFRAIEAVQVKEKLAVGFEDVDDFISYSLSVQNRRKSRMGHALENHLAAIFDAHGLMYERQVRTEKKKSADFLFPGGSEYHDPDFNASLLVMLAAKSTLKDRWRQILTEADRIPSKHLCTIDTRVSRESIDEMRSKDVILIVPQAVRPAYLPDLQRVMLSVGDFIAQVQQKQLH
ncbi:MAG: restriction endonuclease [Chloroflexi bacterium]|nr:restriction endonuclease [Chloroflexota bacterium]